MKFERVLGIVFFTLAVTSAAVAETKASSTSVSPEFGKDRTREALARHKYNRERRETAVTSSLNRLANDQDDVSVIDDDGTLVIRYNLFDLSNRSLSFVPQGAGYTVQTSAGSFVAATSAAVAQQLEDDDSVAVNLPFPFSFYGVAYTRFFLNTDGNLTFTAPDIDTTDRNLRRVLNGPPRIAPLFDDLIPTGTATITVEQRADLVVVSWTRVPELVNNFARSTFQVILHSNGAINFNYQAVSVRTAIVALSPGNAAAVDLTDFSTQTSPLLMSGMIAELFSTAEDVDLVAVAQRFYETHQDAYDEIIVFSDFDVSLGEAFAYELPIRNDIQGIIPGAAGIFDFGTDFGSRKRLASVLNAGSIRKYPADPQQIFLGTNNTLEVIGQEFGHRWLAYVDTVPRSMLGRDQAHWSFFMNTAGSVMEGNEIEDLGNGRFRTIASTYQYSPLDQYLMGLRLPSEVPPWFVVSNPRLASAPASFGCRPITAACPPAVGVELLGTRRDITIQDVIATAGPRLPDATSSQRAFSVAFIILTQKGQEVNRESLAHVAEIRRQWERFFVAAVGGRAAMSTQLRNAAMTQLQLTLARTGSTRVETTLSGTTQTGYGAIDSGLGAAVLRSFSGSSLVSETGVFATPPAYAWTMYAEKGAGFSTGIAIANPNNTAAILSLRLSDGSQTSLQLVAGGQHAAFVDELFGNFTAPFLGTLTIQSDRPVVVLALRGTLNAAGHFIVATVPLSSTPSSSGGVLGFPIIADGGGYTTELILVNSSSSPNAGSIKFSFPTVTDRGTNTLFNFSISAGGLWRIRTNGNSQTATAGFAILTSDSSPLPAATAMVRLTAGGDLISETGVPAQTPVMRALAFASYQTNQQTGLAVFNSGSQAAQITLTAFNSQGDVVAQATTVPLNSLEQKSAFFDQLIAGLPLGFEGTVLLESSSPVYAVSLRGTYAPGNGFLMTTLPMADLTQSVSGPRYFPQVVLGKDFTTEFLFMNSGQDQVHIDFFNAAGEPLALSLQ